MRFATATLVLSLSVSFAEETWKGLRFGSTEQEAKAQLKRAGVSHLAEGATLRNAFALETPVHVESNSVLGSLRFEGTATIQFGGEDGTLHQIAILFQVGESRVPHEARSCRTSAASAMRSAHLIEAVNKALVSKYGSPAISDQNQVRTPAHLHPMNVLAAGSRRTTYTPIAATPPSAPDRTAAAASADSSPPPAAAGRSRSPPAPHPPSAACATCSNPKSSARDRR